MENIIILHDYRKQRWYEYPGVPIVPFTDWYTHKSWMIQQKNKYIMKLSNLRILAEAEEQDNQDKGG